MSANPEVLSFGNARDPCEVVGSSIVPPLASPVASTEMDLPSALLRHWRMILAFSLAGLVLAVVLCRLLAPLYTATATVMIDPRQPKQPAIPADPNSVQMPSADSVRKDQIAIIRSRELAAKVIKREGLDRDPEFNPLLRHPGLVHQARSWAERLLRKTEETIGLAAPPIGATAAAQGAFDNAVILFFKRLKIISPDAPRVIEIAFSSQNPARAAQIANAIARQYMQDQSDRETAEAQFAIRSLTKEIDSVNAKIRDADRKIESMRSKEGLLPNSDLKVLSLEMTELDKQLVRAQAAKIAATYERASADRRAIDVAITTANERALQQKLDALKTQMARATALEADVQAADREDKAYQNLMALLVARLNDTQAYIDRKWSDVRLLSQAVPPTKASFPPRVPIVVVGFLLAASCGAMLGILRERRDNSIRSTDELRQLLPVRIVGAVPNIGRVRSHAGSPAALVLREPTAMFTENLRALWVQIDRSVRPPTRIVVVTSSIKGEGKTSIAVALTRMLALAGRKVLLVDADLRCPHAHQLLELRRQPGLGDLLRGMLESEDVVQRDACSGAYFIAAGSAVGSPADDLQSAKTERMMKYLAEAFEVVIVDTPPVLAVHDAGIIARHATSTVMAVRWGETPAATLASAIQRLDDLDISVTGVVLTMVDLKKYGSYGYGDAAAFASRAYYSS